MTHHTAAVAPVPIEPMDFEDRARLHEQALRYRIMYGQWLPDLLDRLRTDVGAERAYEWGEPDTSANLLNASTTAVAVLYDRKPSVHGRSKAAAALMSALLEDAGWAELMQRVQRDTIAIREMLVRVDVYRDDEGEKRVSLTPAWPHTVEVQADRYDPRRPVRVGWWRYRDQRWTRDVCDISDPSRPAYYVDDGDGEDLSSEYLSDEAGTAPEGGYVGDAYPYRDPKGNPILPFQWYHGAESGRMWDWSTLKEVSEATLNVACAWTYWRHILHNASWPQRYVVGLDVAGAHSGMDGSAQQENRYLTPDPTRILRFLQSDIDAGGQAMPPGQFETSADLHSIGEAIQAYERRALAYAGLSPSEVMRSSGDPRSGYALAVSRDGQRESQRKYAPIFQRYDAQLCGLVAMLYGDLPVGGWSVEYEMLPPSAAEQREQREQVRFELEMGLISKVEAYMAFRPTITEAEAAKRLADLEVTDERRDDPHRDDPHRDDPRPRRGDDDPDPDTPPDDE